MSDVTLESLDRKFDGNVENRVEGLEGQMGELTTIVRSIDRRLSVVEAR